MRWTDRVLRSRFFGVLQIAWISLVVAAFYHENGAYFLTKISDFIRTFRSLVN